MAIALSSASLLPILTHSEISLNSVSFSPRLFLCLALSVLASQSCLSVWLSLHSAFHVSFSPFLSLSILLSLFFSLYFSLSIFLSLFSLSFSLFIFVYGVVSISAIPILLEQFYCRNIVFSAETNF
jgi:hypothetical protein